MKRRIFAMALACALSLSLLASCGGGKAPSGSESGSGSISGSVSGSTSQNGSASSGNQSGGAGSASSDASQPDGSVSEQKPGQSVLALNKTDFTLKSAGATWKLKYTCEPDIDATAEFTSSDEAIATVAQDGTVTAVAPGTATITLKYGDLTAKCIVRCAWEESSKPEKPAEPDKPAEKKVDLEAFYTTVSSNYDLGGFLQKADKELLDAFYPGLSDVATEQSIVYATMMSMNMGEFALIQVKDSKDVDTVKAILQTRIDNMINGGAWYPEPTRVWTESSRIVTNGSYIMMVVNDEYDAIIKDFNKLF